MDEWERETQPDGALTPPPRVPPTAIATSAPLPPRPLIRERRPRVDLRALVNGALDRLDTLGDGIAAVVGLR
ncbi:MAG: hypothetical protein ABJE47_15945 [bacterium]